VQTIDPAFIAGIAALAVLFTSLIFLNLKSTREKFKTTSRSYLLAVVLFLILAVMYFLLQ
jgi:hypothetical protein